MGARNAADVPSGGNSDFDDECANVLERSIAFEPVSAKPTALKAFERIEATRRPPHNIEAEQALLGAILVNNESLDRVSGFLSPGHFFDPLHARIYETLATLIHAGKTATPITVKTFFENVEPIDVNMTVPQYIRWLDANATTTINAAAYGRTIYDLSTRRSLIIIGEDLVNTAYDSTPADTPDDMLSRHETSLERLRSSTSALAQETLIEFAEESKIEDENDDVIEGVIPPASVGFLYGQSGLGKTFLALHAGARIAKGQPFFNRPSARQAVLYVALEGGGRFGRRLRAATDAYELPPKSMARLMKGVILGRESGAEAGVLTILEAVKHLQKSAGMQVGLIIIDTLAKVLAGDDENEAAAISAVIGQATRISKQTGASVMIVHHPGKDAERGMRGSSSLFNDADFVLRLEGEKGMAIKSLRLEKAKDDDEGVIGSFELEKVTIGEGRRGNKISSMIVRPVETPELRVSRKPISRESAAGLALTELEHLIIGGGAKKSQNHERIPDGAMTIEISDWRHACDRKGITPSDKENTRRKTFERAQKTLSDAGAIGFFDGRVWLTRTSAV